ncbi:Thg1-domain-containing protein [Lindgomyces ingoldianus]|uniref:Thg1-domain-containing protein n=1 Tax=Lindgomyces ingoldianus TaxID=673940 RepID=A0ACB6RC66_9PLEO|nr:Thg1-domain-containing protein [Lindgomyces ingoldianus]KAF2476112.1 Thg1-domain-containing protein [Lindgomyces ingoldianus]
MANSKYEYVRSFEQPDILLANTWIVVRIDGRGFSKLTTKYKFAKPNDRRALDLMNAAAEAVMKELPDLVLAYGNSDEFSFVFHKDCVLFERRASKLTTTVVSTFTSCYTFFWPTYFPDSPLTPPLPSFDGRAVCYPSDQNLRDYMSWRQVDCHINNLYNTTFWALVQQGNMDARSAEQELAGTVSSEKNEILFSRFGINYNNEPDIFKKGSVLYRDFSPPSIHSSPTPPRSTTSPPPLSHPRPMSQPLTSSILPKESSTSSDPSTPHGPTFLSTSTTPSPPPSPPSHSIPAFPAALSFPQNFMPMPLPSAPISKQPLPQLTPIPLPPPTLRPTNRPPPSLNPPNPTAHTNTSPAPSPIAPLPIPNRTSSSPPSRSGKFSSHSASASLSLAGSSTSMATAATHNNLNAAMSMSMSLRPQTATASTSKHTLKRRSPSLSILEGAPEIPLRISSIPLNNKPRKLSLPSQKSFGTLKVREKESGGEEENGNGKGGKGLKESPPLPTSGALGRMKELPSPPIDSLQADSDASVPLSPGQGRVSASPGLGSGGDREKPLPELLSNNLHSDPNTSPPVPEKSSQRTTPPLHTRAGSAPLNQTSSSYFPVSSISQTASSQTPTTTKPSKSQSQSKSTSKSKSNSKPKAAPGIPESGSWAAGTQTSEMSKTAKDRDRKKRQRARIVVEHVDVIKDGFWEKRPWILSGRTG